MKKKIILLAAVWLGCSLSVLFAQQPITLSQCIEKARQHNRDLQNAALDIQSSSEQKKEMAAKYLPEISANVTAFQAFNKIVKTDLSQLIGQPYSLHELNRGYSATLTAMQPLYAGGQITAANQLATVGKDVAQLQYSMKEKEVIQKVTENYWQIVSVHYNLQTIEAAEKQLTEVYKQVGNMVETGVSTRNALLKVKLRQQELASNRLKLENASHVLSMLLAQQIGAGTDTLQFAIEQSDNLPDLPTHVNGGIASNSREELLLAAKGVESNQLQIKLERGKSLPAFAIGIIGFHSGFGGFSEAVKSSVNTHTTNALGLATLSIPISSWFGGSHAIRRTKIKWKQAKNNYLDTQEKLVIDTESAWSNLMEAYKQIEIAKANVEESNENYRMTTDQYFTGKETITELLDAETLKRQAQNQLSSAIATYQIRMADYQRKVQ